MLISPSEIVQQAKKWFFPFLSATVDGTVFFPKDIRFGKVKPSWARDRFHELHESLRNLRQGSKEHKGAGYTVVWQKVANRAVGKNEFPVKISIECEEDLLSLLDNDFRKTFQDFKREVAMIRASLPGLIPWVKDHPRKVCQYLERWSSLIEVCHFFMTTHKHYEYYIRELPIHVHTKFIERHKGILNELLTLLLPSSMIDGSYTGTKDHNFEKRYGLKYDETQIRYRLLDGTSTGISDFSIRYSDFAQHKIPGSRVIITENKMNFLTIPKLEDTLAIWGGGFNLHLLKHAEWLRTRHIYYWGDIDAHGFWMLSQLRDHYSDVTSLMMDWDTFRQFEDGAKGEPIANVSVTHLTSEESSLYEHVKRNNLRLEQEKIPLHRVLKQLEKLNR